ncbi:hypothetical protein [Desulfosporosinus sp. HMP52]|nr:hypothetical protein [Desulfosporosinus sp. HMP52]
MQSLPKMQSYDLLISHGYAKPKFEQKYADSGWQEWICKNMMRGKRHG